MCSRAGAAGPPRPRLMESDAGPSPATRKWARCHPCARLLRRARAAGGRRAVAACEEALAQFRERGAVRGARRVNAREPGPDYGRSRGTATDVVRLTSTSSPVGLPRRSPQCGRNWMLMRAQGSWATLGMLVQPGPAVVASITSRSPWPELSRSPGPPDFGRSPNGRVAPERDDPPPSCRPGSRGRCGRHARRRCRCRRGTGTARRRDEWLAQPLGRSAGHPAPVRSRRAPRMGEGFALRVPGEEPRNPHGAVVHMHPLLVPRHGADQRVEQLVGRGDEAGPQVNPGAFDSGRRSKRRCEDRRCRAEGEPNNEGWKTSHYDEVQLLGREHHVRGADELHVSFTVAATGRSAEAVCIALGPARRHGARRRGRSPARRARSTASSPAPYTFWRGSGTPSPAAPAIAGITYRCTRIPAGPRARPPVDPCRRPSRGPSRRSDAASSRPP